MRKQNLITNTAWLAVLLTLAAAPLAAEDKPNFGVQELGEPSNGLRAVLSVNRTSVAPGEVLEFSGYFWNVGAERLVLPYEPHQWPAGELHIRTPKGIVFVYAPKKRVLPEENFYAIPPGRVDRLRDMRLRLNDSNAGWVARDNDAPGTLQLGGEGMYRIWFEYAIPVLPKAGEHGWSGKAISNILAISVQPMPIEKRTAKPTPGQLQDLERMISGEPSVTNEEQTLRGMPYHRLREAMLLTENEGLALEMSKRVMDSWDHAGAKWFQNCVAMLLERAGNGLSEEGPGIDGPYLKALADGVLKRLGQKDAVPTVGRGVLDASQMLPAVMAYARLNAQDKAFREKLVDVLQHSAKVSAWPQWQGMTPPDRKEDLPPVDLTTAWRALQILGVLHDGTSVGDAIEILGRPTDQSDTGIRWYYNTPRHVNPVIFGEIKNGKVVSFTISRA